MKKILCLTLLSMAGTLSANFNDINLGVPSYGGNGCPQGTAAAALSPDKKSLSILFDEFVAEAGGDTNKRQDRKKCDIAIPVHVPSGYSVSIFKLDYRGFNALPRGSKSVFSVEYFFAGTQGPRYTETFRGALEDDFTIENKLRGVAKSHSRCGEDVILRTKASVRVNTNRRREEASIAIDSVDVKSGLVYRLAWRQC